MNEPVMEVGVAQYELEIAIDAPRDAVWRALTQETNAWWLPDFHMVASGSTVTLDARAGGQLVERTEEGGSLLWYTVTLCTPGESLHLVGHLAPAWGGPATTMLHLALVDERDEGGEGDGTVLRVQDALFGRVAEETVESLRSGWDQLFGSGLKRFAEAS